MTINTIPTTVHIVRVESRMDDIYAFSSRREAERFRAAVEQFGGDAHTSDVPLNLTPDHTDDLIASEVDE